MKKRTEIIITIICVIIMLWFAASVIDINLHNMPWQKHSYAKWNMFEICKTETEIRTVVDCQPIENYYLVTVCDDKGNEWAYYDNDYRHVGEELKVTYNGNAITEVK